MGKNINDAASAQQLCSDAETTILSLKKAQDYKHALEIELHRQGE